MKKLIYLLMALMISQNVLATDFITVWKTDNAGTSNSNQITIPTNTAYTTYNYTVAWGDGSSNAYTTNTAPTHTYATAGTYTVSISGTFPAIKFNNGGDKLKLLSIAQWGTGIWNGMNAAFDGCTNMQGTFTDAPIFTPNSSLYRMFANCTSFNTNLNNWDMTNVKETNFMFFGASVFNGNIGFLNTQNITDMNYMFYHCKAYNQALPSSFNTANVTDMSNMFYRCSAYNQALPSSFNTANVTNMRSMFDSCTVYNQILPSSFNTANVTNMSRMFFGCAAYNQALPSSFNTANVTNMNGMFQGCSIYNQALPSSFNTANVTNMSYMFNSCSKYNQLLNNSFNTTNVTDMSYMFSGCTAYNKAFLSSFNTAKVTDMSFMFRGCSAYNEALPSSFNTANVMDMYAMFQGCSIYDQALPSSFNTANVTNMSSMFENCIAYNQALPSSFNTANVTNMSAMFQGCSTYNQALLISFNTANVTDMSNMFSGCSAYNEALLISFNTANVINMYAMFQGCSVYDRALPSSFNTANVTNMSSMFRGCSAYNKAFLSSFNTAKVTDMSSMFSRCKAYDQAFLSSFNTANVTNMNAMFLGCSAYNQAFPSSFNTAKVTNMKEMFSNVNAFNQAIGSWDVALVTDMTDMFYRVTLSTVNYDDLLIGWSGQLVKSNVPFSGGNSKYCAGAAARQSLITNKSWTITDGGYACLLPFITTWKTDNAGSSNSNQITIPTNLSYTTYNYSVAWGDGSSNAYTTNAPPTHTYATAGTYTVSISGTFPAIKFNNSGDKLKLLSITQWGTGIWNGMDAAFRGCANMQGTFTDAPVFAPNSALYKMFTNCTSFNTNLNNWDMTNVKGTNLMFEGASVFDGNVGFLNTQNITDMSYMFSGCTAYKQALPSSFNTANVTNMSYMFGGCSAYNEALPSSFNTANVTDMSRMFVSCSAYNQTLPSSFNTAKVTDMSSMFYGCSTYNQALPSSFNTANVTNMKSMFDSCTVYNQALPSSFNTANVTDMSFMFRDCSAYNQAFPSSFNTTNVTDMSFMFFGCSAYDKALLSSFNTAKVTNMNAMFSNCTTYNQALPSSFNTANVTNMSSMFRGCSAYNKAFLSSFNTAKVTDMSSMFSRCKAYDQAFLSSFNTANVTNMSAMFLGCSTYNQAFLSSFNTAKVTNMKEMFSSGGNAYAFNQAIGSWDVTLVTDMTDMFYRVTLSTVNYDDLLIGWSGQLVKSNVPFSGGNSKYCAGTTARQNLITNKSWTITDGGSATPTATASSNSPVCEATTLNLTGGAIGNSYAWTSSNGFTSTDQSPSIASASASSSGTYTITVSNNGCTATATTQIVINSTPAPTVPTATPSSRTTAGSVTLSATGCSGGTLTWFNATDNAAVPSPNNQPNLTAAGTFNFYAKCTGTNTCVSAASVNVPVTVSLCTPLASSPGNVSIIWTGLVSTDWNNACNWNPAWVPDATNSQVEIPNTTIQPTVTGTVPIINIMYVEAGATLTVASGGSLTFNNTTSPITLQGGNIINNGTIDVSNSSYGITIDASASITNNGTITTNNNTGIFLLGGSLTFTNESTGVFNGNFNSLGPNILTLTNRGTINYAGEVYALNRSGVSNIVNTGTINVTAGAGIVSPIGSTITNSACGKILMSEGSYTNSGTTTNAGLIQIANTLAGLGTFTNNGVLKYINLRSTITNNKMVITNACPIFTLGGTNNYTVSGIFTDATATTSAGDYVSVGNKFTANNIIPTGTQTLYAQVTDGTVSGACTFTVPFDFDNVKPTAVSVSNTTVCTGGSVTLLATCASGTITWYTTATGGTSIGTGASLSQSPTGATTYYAACESTNCASGRVATSAVTINTSPPTATASSNSPICEGTTLNLTGGATGNSYAWTSSNGFTSTDQSPSITSASVSSSGTYTITVSNNGCSATATTAVVVNPSATASISYTGSPFSKSASAVSVNFTGTTGGTFSSSPAGLTISSSTGQITPSSSTLGTYTVTYTLAANGGCPAVTATTSITIGLPFITTWKTDNVGTSNSNQITIPTNLSYTTYNYSVDWGDGSNNAYTTNAAPTHTYATAGTYTVSITGTFPAIKFADGGDKLKLLSIIQWGSGIWNGMDAAFDGCANMQGTFTDAPVFAPSSTLYKMFANCTSFNTNLNNWDMTNVKETNFMFFGASVFNGTLDNWNTVNVTSMEGMFGNCAKFNQALPSSFNTANVTNMSGMFKNCSDYNQALPSSFNTANVTDMSAMFQSCSNYNRALPSSFNTANVTNMSFMFFGCSAYDKAFLISFNTANVMNMSSMFSVCRAYNKAFLSSFNTAKVTNMRGMFSNADAFDQPIGSWDVALITDMTDMFYGVTLSTANYDDLLTGWAGQLVKSNIPFSGGNSKYCAGVTARQSLITNKLWTITDGGYACLLPFITTWKTDNTGTSNSNQITIPTNTFYTNYNYSVDWGDGSNNTYTTNTAPTHTYATAGTYTVSISGTFPAIKFNDGGDKLKLLSITQWGTGIWSGMDAAFHGCANMQGTFTDAPFFAPSSTLYKMFANCTSFNTNLNNWDMTNVKETNFMFDGASVFNGNVGFLNTQNITDMSFMFRDCSAYNQALPSSFNTANVTYMSNMFQGCSAYNQAFLSSFNTANVTNMSGMFFGCSAYTKALPSSFNTANVTNMSGMFQGCSAYNQAFLSSFNTANVTNMSFMFYGCSAYDKAFLSSFNTANVTDMSSMFSICSAYNQALPSSFNTANVINMNAMFSNANAFNQPIGSWDVTSVTDMTDMFYGVTLSTANYDDLLTGWAGQMVKSNVPFSGGNSKYCAGVTARQSLITNKLWTITDGGSASPTATASSNSPICAGTTLNLTGGATGNSYAWTSSNGFTSTDQNPSIANASISSSGTYTITVSNNGCSATATTTVVVNATATATISYTGSPFSKSASAVSVNFTGTTGGTFSSNPAGLTLSSSTGQITPSSSTLGTYTVSYTLAATGGCPAVTSTTSITIGLPFITTWKTDNVGISNSTSITIPTTGTGYNYDVDWNNDGIYDQFGISGNATHDYLVAGTYSVAIRGSFPRIYFSFAGDKRKILSVDQWGDIAWQSMASAFSGCSNLAGNATDAPDLSRVTDMSSMFYDASVFNQNIGNWNVSNVTNMNSMFNFATAFNGNIGTWNVSNVINMASMFSKATAFNGNIGTWNVGKVTNMEGMFSSAIAFDQNIGAWNVSNVINMKSMFSIATAFNGNIELWNVGKVTNMEGMFSSTIAFDRNIGAWDVSKVTTMNSMFAGARVFNQDIGSWNVSRVTDMNGMFLRAHAFDQDISLWNVGNVTDMENMFFGAKVFNQNLNSWNVSRVTDMSGMFSYATAFDESISSWNVSNVTNMSGMFRFATSFNHSIGSWNVGKVTDMSYMFSQAPAFDQDISAWDVAKVTNMNAMFRSATVFNQDISVWNVNNVTDMYNLFFGATSFNRNIGAWNITKATSMEFIFKNSGINVSNYDATLIAWNTAGYTNKTLGDASPLKYCAGQTARTNMITNKGWVISDDAFSNACNVVPPTGVSVSSTNICAGNPISLSATCASGVVTWYNQNSGGTAIGTGSPFSHSPTASIIYHVSCNDGTTESSLVATNEVTVSSTPPTATASSNSPICVGTTLNLTGGATGNSYAWTSSNGFTSTDQNPSIPNASVLASGTYQITVTNVSGCTATATTTVIVNAPSTATISYTGSPFSKSASAVNVNFTGTTGGTFSSSPAGLTISSSTGQITPSSSTLGTYTVTYTLAATGGCPAVTSTTSITIGLPFITTWKTDNTGTSNSNQITIPTNTNYTYNYTVAWGDGSSDAYTTNAAPTHTYATAGTYTVSISGTFPAIKFNDGGDKLKLLSITQWGTGIWSGMDAAFRGCANMQGTFTDAPVFAPNSTLYKMFEGCTSFNTNLNNWDMSNVRETNFMFNGATNFDGTLDNWNTANVTSMEGMFENCAKFNQALPSSFNTANVTDMSRMFRDCGAYKQALPISFNTANVTNMRAMFEGCTSFDKALPNSFNTANVTDMSSMFSGCSAYNQALPNSFNTTNVTNMSVMFQGCSKYDQAFTSSFNTTNVTDMSRMFRGCIAYNKAFLSSFNTAKVTDMSSMFSRCNAYDQAFLSSFNTAKVTNMNAMFLGCSTYNQAFPSSFNTAKVTNMKEMFSNANAFNQAIGSLDVTSVTDMTDMFYKVTLSTANYDDLLTGWAGQLVKSNVPFSGGNSKYCAGAAARQNLITNKLWTITDGGSAAPTLTVGTATNPTTCTGTNGSIAFTTTNLPNGTYTLNYSKDGTATTASITVATNAFILGTLGAGTYTPFSITNASCTGSVATSIVLTDPATPTATASNNSPICAGTTLNLTGGGIGTYSWTSSNGYTSNVQSPSIPSATASMSGTYTITVTNANGCTSTATTSVTVNPVTATPTPQANTQIIFGASITLTATGCSGVNDVLKWYKSSDNSLAVMPVSPTVLTNFYAKCERTLNGITCISSNSVDVTVTVLSPNPPVATGVTNCVATPTTLTATGCSGSVGTFVLKWYQNLNNVLVTMPVSATATTDYYAKCEQTFNSVTAVSGKSNVVTLTILNPIAPVSTGGTIYLGNSISLTATGCTGVGFTIKWYQTSDNLLVTMPVSPTVTTQYYSKCEQIANLVTCLSPKSNNVTVKVVGRIFVDIANVNSLQNGNSWTNAFSNLQVGLLAASTYPSPDVEVWVAKGTYKPTTNSDRTISFAVPTGTKLIGGFAGTEATLAERNFRINASILSGEIGNQGLLTDNTYHVVRITNGSNATVIDGFTITNGFAATVPPVNISELGPPTGAPTEIAVNAGGGILAENSLVTITNCTIQSNQATFGAGIFMSTGSSGTISFCKITGNLATFGGGIYNFACNPDINNCQITGNKALGGGIYNNDADPTISNVTIAANNGFLGSIYNTPSAPIESNPIIKNSIIWDNSGTLQVNSSVISYSVVQGGYAGTFNLTQDPLFVSPQPPGVAPITTGDYHLKAKSLAIDRGQNGSISLTDKDLDGNLRRFAGGRVDMGTYEFQGVATVTLVISVASGNWNANATWENFRIPQLGDYVIIDSNHIVTLNGTGTAKNLEYRGTGKLIFIPSSILNIGF